METPKTTTLDLTKDAPSLPSSVVRRMNHREWLFQFALMLESDPPPKSSLVGERAMRRPMTPFRMGAITRLRYAAQYCGVLEDENAALQRDLDKALAALEHHLKEEELRDDTGR